MPPITGKPGFNYQIAEQAAKDFKAAMKGFGTDEKRIIKNILAFTNAQRQVIEEKYLSMYGSSLEEDLKSELKGEFEEIVLALLKPRFVYEAESMRSAINVNL